MPSFAAHIVIFSAVFVAVTASPESGKCVVTTNTNKLGTEPFSCSQCQKQCLDLASTSNGYCVHISFDGQVVPLSELPTWNCAFAVCLQILCVDIHGPCDRHYEFETIVVPEIGGDAYWTSKSPGLCVLFDYSGKIFDTQNQNCIACAQQCQYDGRCAYTFYNFQRYGKESFTEHACGMFFNLHLYPSFALLKSCLQKFCT